MFDIEILWSNEMRSNISLSMPEKGVWGESGLWDSPQFLNDNNVGFFNYSFFLLYSIFENIPNNNSGDIQLEWVHWTNIKLYEIR